MNHGDKEEFYIAVSIYGVMILVGLVATIVLAAFGSVILRSIKDKKLIKKIYGQERKNGKPGNGKS